VVAVDDRDVGNRDVAQRVEARLPHELQLGTALGELDQLRLRRRIDGADTRVVLTGPLHEQAGEVAGVGADLDDGTRIRGLQTGDEQLGQVDERGAPVPRIVRVRVDVGSEPFHGAAAV
jgi:hypothetical protein